MIKNILEKTLFKNFSKFCLNNQTKNIYSINIFNLSKFNFARKESHNREIVEGMFTDEKEKKIFHEVEDKKSTKVNKKPKIKELEDKLEKDTDEKNDKIDQESFKVEIQKPQYENILKDPVSIKAAPTESKITTKILCEIIGSKHYPANEEIELTDDAFVAVYDENDKLLFKTTLGSAQESARSVGKDLVLRNAKASPPIVKMMKYRLELVKRLMKKVGKNLGKEFQGAGKKEEVSMKYMSLSLKMDKKDFNTKVDKIRQILAEHPLVKIVIPIDLNSNEQLVKAISILKNVQVELYEMGKLHAGPIKQRKKEDKIVKVTQRKKTSKLLDDDDAISQENLEKDYYKMEGTEDVGNERDLDFIDSIYIEIESLIADNTGVDYEKLLEGSNIDNVIRGVTHTNVIGELTSQSKLSNVQFTSQDLEANIKKGISITKINKDDSAETIGLKKQIQNLEKEVVLQKDFGKKLHLRAQILDLEDELEYIKRKLVSKGIKSKMKRLLRRSAKLKGIVFEAR